MKLTYKIKRMLETQSLLDSLFLNGLVEWGSDDDIIYLDEV